MIERKELAQLIDNVLKVEAFIRSGITWRSESDEIITVLGLQKSNYDKSWFLNIGFWVKELDEARSSLRQEQCHVQARAQELWPNREPSPDELLGELAMIANSVWTTQLELFLCRDLLPVLQQGVTIISLRNLLVEFPRFRVRKTAHELLGYSV